MFPPAEELGSPDATKFLLSLAQGLPVRATVNLDPVFGVFVPNNY